MHKTNFEWSICLENEVFRFYANKKNGDRKSMAGKLIQVDFDVDLEVVGDINEIARRYGEIAKTKRFP